MPTQNLSEHIAVLPTNQTPLTANPPEPQISSETGGVTGPEPTRYGDWEKNGRCVDF
ncbi:DUF1674 domain-containing protein [Crenothrix polyspora]|uniref:DUF1674 domain-containing protein n=1 Tax=Crenothrix polyspora TaxID=360316 RepID=A0A1R4H3K7_9GAMM|nr:succinate dehydrogenase assembly factor 4 [Crenothrix polyspora]SJM90757.1 hypothetical protein CRENPOLYSF1_1540020 [Crenothrix polyspora]